jgi:hypothetical protein
MASEQFSMYAEVREILFRCPATPLPNNKTPAEMYLQRNIRIQLYAILPMKQVQNTDHAVKSRQISVGERMQTRCYIKNQAVGKLGTIFQKFWKFRYQVKLDDDYIYKGHVNQIRKTKILKRSLSFVPSMKSKRTTIQPINR